MKASRFVGLALVALVSPALSGLANAQQGAIYEEPGIYRNRDYINYLPGEHIDPFTGRLQLHQVDVVIPGNGGLDVRLQRSYNAIQINEGNPPLPGLLGIGWSFHFGKLRFGANGSCNPGNWGPVVGQNPTLTLPDGSSHIIYAASTGYPPGMAKSWWKAECAPGASGMLVTSPDGVAYEMTQADGSGGYLTKKITDRNGNTLTFTYQSRTDGAVVPTQLDASDGRQVTFAYEYSGGRTRLQSYNAAGRTWSFAYQTVGNFSADIFQLSSVQGPEGLAWQYSYLGQLPVSQAGSFSLQQVKVPYGGTVTYTYALKDFSGLVGTSPTTVVATKATSDGGNWTFSYAPSSGFGVLDTTTMTGPEGTTIWKHFGYNTISNGEVWKLGLLAEKRLGAEQVETMVWTSRQISIQTDFRAPPYQGKSDAGAFVPVLQERTITRDGTAYRTAFSNFDLYGNYATVTETGNATRTSSRTYFVNPTLWIVKQLKNHVISGGTSLERDFYSNGNMSREARNGVATTFQYDGDGNVSQSTNARGFSRTFLSYFRGVPQTENHPEGVGITRVVDGNGNVTSQRDGELFTTLYAYDGLNRISQVTPPRGALTTISRSFSIRSTTVTRGALTETTSFDTFGRPVSVNRGGVVRQMDYDALGRKTFESYPGSSLGTRFEYDVLGRITKTTHGDGSFVRIDYQSLNREVETNERGHVTTRTYRSFGDPGERQLMGIAAPVAAASVSIERNGNGDIESLTQDGVTRTFGYDARYFLTSATHPETGTTFFGRDAIGNMTTRRVGTSLTTNFGYDALDRLESITYLDGSTPSVTKTYFRTGLVKQISTAGLTGKPGIVRQLDYDGNRSLTSDSVTIGGVTRTLTMGYDNLDQLNTITYPSGLVVTYQPDSLGRPQKALPFVTAASWRSSGNPLSMTMANGVTTTFGEQASRQWPNGISASRAGVSIVNATFGFDLRGNIDLIGDQANSANDRTLGYDPIDRLVSASGPWGTGTVSYNGSGDVMSQVLGGAGTTFTYLPGSRRLGTVTVGGATRSLGYDVYGNVTSNGLHEFRYDEASRLECVDCTLASKTDYVYDGEGHMTRSIQSGVETIYLYSLGGKLMGEYIPSRGNYRREHAYLQGKRVGTRTVVTEAASATALSVNPTSISFGGSVSMTASVTGSSPTGSIAFKDGASVIAGCNSVPLVGASASCATTQLPVGTRSITAAYSGDTFNLASTSAAVSVTILPVPDPAPDAFGFAAKTAVTRSAPITSDPLTPVGYNVAASVSVANGSYSIGCTATYVTTGGTISPGQSVCVRHQSSPNYGTWTTTTLTIGGISGSFSSLTVQSFGVTVGLAGSGMGTVASSPAGISCGTTCSASFDEGTSITLTATPAAGSIFTGWSGGPCAGTAPCTFTMATTFAVTATFTNPSLSPRLLNISTRGPVQTGDSIMIGGFIIGGSVPKTVLITGVGPSLLSYGVPDALANPVIQLYSGSTVIAANDDWGTASNAATIQALGMAPAHPLESAILATLNPGAYTVFLYGAAGGTGNGMISVSEIDRPESPLINISTRGQVLTGGNVMIAGLIIGGTSPQTVVVRARGPSLAPAGIPNYLPNPLLQLFSGATQIAVNDDWGTAANAATLQALGYHPSHPNESAILVTLYPGAYTAIVSGVGGTTGMGIVEVFAVLP